VAPVVVGVISVIPIPGGIVPSSHPTTPHVAGWVVSGAPPVPVPVLVLSSLEVLSPV